MKDFPAVQSSLIARPVQKTRIKQRAKQMAQMRAGRGSEILENNNGNDAKKQCERPAKHKRGNKGNRKVEND